MNNSIAQLQQKLKHLFLFFSIALTVVIFAFSSGQHPEPTRSVSPDLVLFSEETRAILVTSGSRTWVMEV